MNITYLLDRMADGFPEETAFLLEDGGSRTWREVCERVDGLAGGLKARGIVPGDRVAILALNGPHYLEVSWAVARIGAILQPMNMRLNPQELAYQRADAEPKILFLGESFAELAGAFAQDLPMISVEPRTGPETMEDLIKADSPLTGAHPVAAEHTLGIFYTSGTTGKPKGVMLTHGSVLANAAFLVAPVGYGADDITLHAAPMFHVSDFSASFAQLIAGGRHAFIPRFDPVEVLGAIERYRVTNLILIPVMINALVNHPEVGNYDLSSLQFLFYGGSPIPASTLRACFEILPCELTQSYGQTELTHTACMLTREDHRRAAVDETLLATCGRPLQGVHVRIDDGAGGQLPVGEIGEILVRAPIVMKGYWNNPEATAEVLRDEWLHTGDMGFQDPRGYISLVDRKKDMIISGGENVYSAEVESALADHSAVAECTAIAVPDDRLGERVHAVVVLREGATAEAEDLQKHCRRTIAGYKIPRSFEFVDALPRTGTGKVRKDILRETHWRDQDRQIQ
ncbi:MAG: long-chain fatty acid--CoA ligase [Alphaproteobacteria bacterium]|jgi:long-chain acyl-CoA synthetase|nr:long-chain fatty acid--CoA ligase [Alphaproteobacteria bacterium]